MKKIEINNITFADKSSYWTKRRRHSVALGNGITVYFTNINNAKQFLAKTNRFLNDRMFELNQLLIDVFREYRLAWFHLKKESELISHSLITSESIFNRLVKLNYSANYNMYTFIDLKKIVNLLLQSIDEMRIMYRRKKYYVQLAYLGVIEKRLKQLDKAVAEYGGINPIKGGILHPPGG